MNKIYKNMLPKWYDDDSEKYDLVLTDDIDSLLSCKILEQVKNWKIRYFYDFNYIYASTNLKGQTIKERVYVDCSVIKGKCFDNHVNRLSTQDSYNKEMINPNRLWGVTRENYTEKYNLSTVLLLWSIYDLPLPETEEGKMLLLCIDAGYAGYYKGFRNQTYTYLVTVLGLNELYTLLGEHTEEDFKKLMKKYKLNGKISYNENGMSTDIKLDKISKILGIDLTLPEDEFIQWKELIVMEDKLKYEKKKEEVENLEGVIDALFSIALTYTNQIRYSLVMQPQWK